jgi:putative hydrolase of the HAD superfamily
MRLDWLAKMALTPDAETLLAALEIAAIPFGIITNAPASQRIKTRRLGIEDRTECIFISQEFGADKPHPSIFMAAAECLGVTCDQILFVGDSPHHDMIGAHNAGMQAAWLRRGRYWPEEHKSNEPAYVIDSLMEVFNIVASQENCTLSSNSIRGQMGRT